MASEKEDWYEDIGEDDNDKSKNQLCEFALLEIAFS